MIVAERSRRKASEYKNQSLGVEKKSEESSTSISQVGYNIMHPYGTCFNDKEFPSSTIFFFKDIPGYSSNVAIRPYLLNCYLISSEGHIKLHVTCSIVK